MALDYLRDYRRAFILRNGFHVNGDQIGAGLSGFRYRPFTLEGNFAAAAAVQEMLIQSYSGTVRLFPAIPASWEDVSFHRLRAEGAFLFSARRVGGLTRRVEIVAERGGPCRLADPFDGADFEAQGISRAELERTGGELRLATEVGQRIALVRG